MGAGQRYNNNTQKGNPQQSPNYGGNHTGSGKYRHGGIYSHGFRNQFNSHMNFTPGTRIEYIGSHKDFTGKGPVLSKNNKCPRSTIRVQMDKDNKIVYIHKNCLFIE